MKCNTILQNNLHEKYILNKLEKKDKKEYEKHLQECSSCVTELQKQKLIITGIQEIGKKEMKEEICRQIEVQKTIKQSISWEIILRAAAVLFFVVLTPITLYYYNNISPESNSEILQTKSSSSETEEVYSPSPDQEKRKIETGRDISVSGKIEQQPAQLNNKNERSSKQVTSEKDVLLKTKGNDLKISSTPSGKEDKSNLFSETAAAKEENIQMEDERLSSGSSTLQPQDKRIYRLILPQSSKVDIQSEIKEIKLSSEKQKIQDGKPTTLGVHPEMQTINTLPQKLSGEGRSKSFSESPVEESLSEKKNLNIKVLHFLSGTDIIQVNLTLNEDTENQYENFFPTSFKIHTVFRETNFLEMNWLVNRHIYELNPLTFKLEKENPIILNAILADSVFYEINLDNDTSTAKLSQ